MISFKRLILAAAFFRSTLLMLMLLVGGGIANVPLPAISALTLDKCPRAVRTESLSLLYLSSNIGSAVGPLIAGLLFYRHTQEMFYVMAAASVVVLLMTAFLVSDARRLPPEETPGRSSSQKPAPAVSAPQQDAGSAGPAEAHHPCVAYGLTPRGSEHEAATVPAQCPFFPLLVVAYEAYPRAALALFKGFADSHSVWLQAEYLYRGTRLLAEQQAGMDDLGVVEHQQRACWQ